MSEQLPALLLDKAVNFHCRKHNVNRWCDCSFCVEKRRWTYYMSLHWRFNYTRKKQEAGKALERAKEEL